MEFKRRLLERRFWGGFRSQLTQRCVGCEAEDEKSSYKTRKPLQTTPKH